jgi:hypothetical protein
MRDFFLSSPWPGTIAWALIYISDFVLTITCARLYRKNLANKIVFEGSFELNPVFERDVDSMKYFSPRFLVALVLSSTFIAIAWVLGAQSSPGLYAFLLGAVMCVQLTVHVRHIGNLHFYGSRLSSEQISGRIEYPRPVMLSRSSVQLLGFVLLFAVVFVFTGNWFIGGGMFSCSVLSAKHWLLARQAARKRSAELVTRPSAN